MAKYTYIFYLKDNSIRVNEVGTNNSLHDVKVKGFYKYEYKSPDDFDSFFAALKDDSGIESFADFNIFILNWGVDEGVLESFKSHLAGCPSVMVLNSETSRALTENVKDGELEELQKTIAERESEINSLNGKIEDETNAHKEEIYELKKQLQELNAQHVAEMEELKSEFSAKTEPVRTAVIAPCSGSLEFGKNEISKSESGNYSEQWNSKKNFENIFYVKDEEIGRIKEDEETSNNKTSLNSSIFFGILGSIYNSLKYESVKSPAFGFVFAKKNSCKVEKDEIIAVISSDCNDTEEKIAKWLEKNGSKSEAVQGGNESKVEA